MSLTGSGSKGPGYAWHHARNLLVQAVSSARWTVMVPIGQKGGDIQNRVNK